MGHAAPLQQSWFAAHMAPDPMQHKPVAAPDVPHDAPGEFVQHSDVALHGLPTGLQQRYPYAEAGSGTVQELAPLQHRLESEQGSCAAEQLHVPVPALHARLQHCVPSVPPDPAHVPDAAPGWRQHVASRHATVVSYG